MQGDWYELTSSFHCCVVDILMLQAVLGPVWGVSEGRFH